MKVENENTQFVDNNLGNKGENENTSVDNNLKEINKLLKEVKDKILTLATAAAIGNADPAIRKEASNTDTGQNIIFISNFYKRLEALLEQYQDEGNRPLLEEGTYNADLKMIGNIINGLRESKEGNINNILNTIKR